MAIVADLRKAGAIPQQILAELEALLAKLPNVETVIQSLLNAVGVSGINWPVLLSVVGAALASGGGIGAVVAAILMNLGAILTSPQQHAVAAAAALAKHVG